MDVMARALILLGVVLVAVGVVLWMLPSIPWLGRLPGDIRIERPGLTLYFPLTTSILVSVVLSVLLYVISRFR